MDKHYLYGFMSGADDDDAPDGAWWAMLQGTAAECLGVDSDSDEAFEAVHGYIAYLATDEGAKILGKSKATISPAHSESDDDIPPKPKPPENELFNEYEIDN